MPTASEQEATLNLIRCTVLMCARIVGKQQPSAEQTDWVLYFWHASYHFLTLLSCDLFHALIVNSFAFASELKLLLFPYEVSLLAKSGAYSNLKCLLNINHHCQRPIVCFCFDLALLPHPFFYSAPKGTRCAHTSCTRCKTYTTFCFALWL